MRTRNWCALLLGSLLPMTALAGKPAASQQEDTSSLLKSLVPSEPSPQFDRADMSRLMAPDDPMAEWVRSRRHASLFEREDERPVGGTAPGGPTALGKMDWQASGGIRGLIHDYNALGDRVKTRLFGETLSRKLEIDLDGSPEIKYKIEFD